ncbi:uncharacterized protein LOC135377535 [Ornithodoros turicata]|uniref:uncharacterized protein LOC135377535 n=1 Tax=Ornithodoros turicata TaxID=34597 RepID=UPI0031388A91
MCQEPGIGQGALLVISLVLWTAAQTSRPEGRHRGRMVSRVTRTLTLAKRRPPIGFTQHIKPPREIDPLPEVPRVPMPQIDLRDLRRIVDLAAEAINDRLDKIEPAIYQTGAVQRPGSPAWFIAAGARTKISSKNHSRIALIAEEATRTLAAMYNLSKDQISYSLPTVDVRSTILSGECPLEVDFPCQPHKYRAFSGYCNNVQNPTWGNANMRYFRLIPPDYSDGVGLPRHALDKLPLPSARDVSVAFHLDADEPHAHLTVLLAVFGEFITHDLAHTAQSAGFQGHRLKCCGVDLKHFHPECFPIRVSQSDPSFSSRAQTCLEYARSCPALRTGCTLGPREQVNQVTSFLDGSVIYGSSEQEANRLRTFHNGELKVQKTRSGRDLLPPDDDGRDCKSSEESRCFMSGDIRANENVGLMIMHIIWAREHNRIARTLATINPHWDDHTLFEETRRIIGAELQHITYTELLPAVLGQGTIDAFDLRPQSSGYYSGYDINIDAGVSNAVATSVFGFLFSMMPGHFDLYTQEFKKVGEMPMSKTFFHPEDIYANRMNDFLMGMLSQRAQKKDQYITREMTNSLFYDQNTGESSDLAAMIIQQGRDHGIAGYVQWRKFCRLNPVINSFQDLHKIMSRAAAEKLAKIYRNVEDIDLFTGGLAETAKGGVVVGPTFACLLGRQFHYLRRGDRFWYENDIPPSAFTREQLTEIRKTSLARVICDNADAALYLQPKTMLMADPFLNAYQSCETANIPSADLRKWKAANPRIAIPQSVISESLDRAKKEADILKDSERNVFVKHIGVASDDSPMAAHLGLLRPKRQARLISNHSRILELASQGFANGFLASTQRDFERENSTLREIMSALPSVDVSELLDIPRVFACDDQTLPCDHTTKFRTITGWCNNLRQPELGKSMRAFARMLPSAYNDDMSQARSTSLTGEALPSARLVSSTMHYDTDVAHRRYSLMVMQWGQFTDHDLTLTPMTEGFGGTPLDCKACDSPVAVNPECMPIRVPKNDPFYPERDGDKPNCIHFVRSLPGQLTLGRREQLNQVTAFLDASNIYGSDNCDSKMLRAFLGGRLNSTRNPITGKDLLPQTATHPECRAPSRLCFEAGDNRASEQPALAAMHTIFMREHNRIVKELQSINTHWGDELLYQNGRRIMSAVLQHITYNEFLPRILGRQAVANLQLALKTEGYSDDYDESCDPTVFNEFGAAAFRFGHSLISPFFQRLERGYRHSEEPLQLRRGFFNSDMLYSANAVDKIMRGLLTSSMENIDNSITEEVTNHLFEDVHKPFSGMDLVALNIQRARDHGIPGYNQYRVLCNLTRADNFSDLSKEVPQHLIQRLASIYRNVDDIDLFTGGLIETSLHGGVVGPTFGCIIGLQFQRLKKCDRFWYETNNPLIRFTEVQLSEIRKVTLSKIVCDNSDNIDAIQRSAFDQPDEFLNPRTACLSLPKLDLEEWKERFSCTVGKITIDVGAAERISPCVMCTCTKEGPLCQSLRINNCFLLAKSFSKNYILADHVCKVQCAFAFRALPQVETHRNNVLGFST